MSLIRSFIPEDDYGQPRPVTRHHRLQALGHRSDHLPFGVTYPKVPYLPVAMAVECIHPTLSLNTGERLIGVLWRHMCGVLHVMVRIGDRTVYVPIFCLRPLAARHDHLFPHWKRPQRRAA